MIFNDTSKIMHDLQWCIHKDESTKRHLQLYFYNDAFVDNNNNDHSLSPLICILHFFRAKSSSSRFTTSDKYENLFQVRTTSLQINEMLYEPCKKKIPVRQLIKTTMASKTNWTSTARKTWMIKALFPVLFPPPFCLSKTLWRDLQRLCPAGEDTVHLDYHPEIPNFISNVDFSNQCMC